MLKACFIGQILPSISGSMLVLHIGLPKTATTYLQTWIFPRLPGYDFFRIRSGPVGTEMIRSLKRFVHSGNTDFQENFLFHLLQVLNEAENASPKKNVLISNENISLGRGPIWRGTPVNPEEIGEKLAVIANQLPSTQPPMKIIIGIRRQDQWLASRYAESSIAFPDFCQADFDLRMKKIVMGGMNRNEFAWLDFDLVHKTFSGVFGSNNLLMVPMERLADDQTAMLGEITNFLGVPYLLGEETGRETQSKRTNQLSIGENQWRMRKDGSCVALPPFLESALRKHFADSNRRLSEKIPLGFEI